MNPQVRYLLETLNKQVDAVRLAPFGLTSTYNKIAQCSKTALELTKWGMTIEEAYRKAAALND